MVNFNKSKKGVELALNTIVIAILIVIVLLVIILIFTGKIGSTSKTLDQNSATACSVSNAAIKTMGYKHAELRLKSSDCTGGYEQISVISVANDAAGNAQICCGIK